MASIQSSIMLHDSISVPLYNITSALDMTISAFEDMQETANNSFDSATLEGARNHINAANIEIEEMVQNINEAGQQQQNLNNSLNDGTNAASGLESKLLKIVATYATMKTANAVLNISDTMVETTARLNLMNDGLQTTKDLQNMIYLSAQNSRSEYQATADMVSQLGLNAKDAFSSNVELIRFAEQLNKSMVIAGASGMAAESTIYNLTQALSTGVLRGQDLNAVLSNSPNIVQNIADYLDVPIGKIRDMAADGQITAEIVKNAMLAATDATNAAFESMPMTFGQIATSIKNDALMAFDPILARLNEIANGEQFQVMIDGIVTSLVFVSGVVIEIFDLVSQVGSFIAENWSIISPIIYGIITALGLYSGYLTVTNGLELISNGIKVASTIASYAYAAATGTAVAATTAQTAAQMGLNTAMLASPITWVIISVIALVAAFYMGVAALNKFAGTSISATGIIAGVFTVLGSHIYNGFIVRTWNSIAAFVNFFGNVFNDPVASIKVLFYDLAQTVIGYILNMASAIENIINKIPGVKVDITSGLDSFYNQLESASQKVKDEAGWVEVVGTLDYIDYGKAWDVGYSFGEGIEDKISNFSLSNLMDSGNIPNPDDYMDFANGFESMPSNLDNIAKNTGSIKDSLASSEEELKYMRDMAEQEVINRFTTAKIEVDMSGMKNIVNNEMDLDGVVSYLGEGIEEQMEIIAEGIHK